jgi:Zn-dependent M28 family amino/carboxypeptidase
VALALYPSTFSESGTVAAQWGGGIEENHPSPPSVALAVEHYNRLQRLSQHGIPTRVEIEVAVETQPSVAIENLIAELPGTHPGEIVMVGAHLDSWHGGTGATDNAAGAAIAIEALRILKTMDIPLRRTVRLALWSGEEQGEIGSKAYVNALPKTMHGIQAYINLDAGVGRVRGVYTHGNRAAIPLVRGWLEPWRELGATSVSARRLAGSDHFAFTSAGIPALSFIQDPLDYPLRTWHTSMDVFDRLQPDDLKQASALTAAILFQIATAVDAMPASDASAK